MRVRHLFRTLLLLSLLSPSLATGQVPPGFEPSRLTIDPPYLEAAPGGVVTFTVGAISTLGGTIVISLGEELTLVGAPFCNGVCIEPIISTQPDGTDVEITFQSESVAIGVSVTVSSTAPVGTSTGVNAIMVGGVQTVEMASASVYITAVMPTHAPLPDDNRMVYLETSPLTLRIAPGGSVLYHIQPVRWGMWNGSEPTMLVTVSLPPGLTGASDPLCGRGDIVPTDARCETTMSQEPDGSTTYAISPGHEPIDRTANGIYLQVQADDELGVGELLEVTISVGVEDDTLPQQPVDVISTLQTVNPENLLIPQESPGTVGALLEIREGFAQTGSGCSAPPITSEIGLYQIGLNTKFGTTIPQNGQLGDATDGSGKVSCFVPLMFTNVPPRDAYVVATSYGDELPCRACIFGTVTNTDNAEIVFPRQ